MTIENFIEQLQDFSAINDAHVLTAALLVAIIAFIIIVLVPHKKPVIEVVEEIEFIDDTKISDATASTEFPVEDGESFVFLRDQKEEKVEVVVEKVLVEDEVVIKDDEIIIEEVDIIEASEEIMDEYSEAYEVLAESEKDNYEEAFINEIEEEQEELSSELFDETIEVPTLEDAIEQKKDNYTNLKLVELKEIAKNMGLTKYSKFKKAELIDFIIENQTKEDE